MKLYHIFLLASGFLLLDQQTASAQTADTLSASKFKHSVGLVVGATTGYGLGYRYRTSGFGAQINYGPYKTQQKFSQTVGLTFLYTLVNTPKSNFYLYQGNSLWSTRDTYQYYDYRTGMYIKENYTENTFQMGIGTGMEFTVQDQVGINIMFGYGFYDDFQFTFLTGEFGLLYKF